MLSETSAIVSSNTHTVERYLGPRLDSALTSIAEQASLNPLLFRTIPNMIPPKGGRMKGSTHLVRNLAAACLLLLAVAPIQSQTTLGTIRGLVIDSTAAVVPEVNIAVRNVDTNISGGPPPKPPEITR